MGGVLLSPRDTGQYLGHLVVMTLGAPAIKQGGGQGCCFLPDKIPQESAVARGRDP